MMVEVAGGSAARAARPSGAGRESCWGSKEGGDGVSARAYKQVCIIPFTCANLLKFTNLPPTPLEQAESIDMMRVLEHGYTVRMVESAFETHAVDVPDDIPAVERLMAQDPIASRY